MRCTKLRIVIFEIIAQFKRQEYNIFRDLKMFNLNRLGMSSGYRFTLSANFCWRNSLIRISQISNFGDFVFIDK